MKVLSEVALVLGVLLSLPGDSPAQAYFSGGREIPLKIDSTRVRIRFDQELDWEARQAVLREVDQVGAELAEEQNPDRFYTYSVTHGVEQFDDFLDELERLPGVYLVEPFYLTEEHARCSAACKSVSDSTQAQLLARLKVCVRSWE